MPTMPMTATRTVKPEPDTSGVAQSPEELAEKPPEWHPTLSILIDLQQGPLDTQQCTALPTAAELQRWVLAALDPGLSPRHAQLYWPTELTIRITDEAEIAELNQRYRGRSGPTNILSFPFEPPPGIDPTESAFAGMSALLGDLLICAPLVQREAAEQDKSETAHWAHLVVHGTLHLLGFDHMTAAEAASMETLETGILGALGFPPPYEVNDDANGERRRI